MIHARKSVIMYLLLILCSTHPTAAFLVPVVWHGRRHDYFRQIKLFSALK